TDTSLTTFTIIGFFPPDFCEYRVRSQRAQRAGELGAAARAPVILVVQVKGWDRSPSPRRLLLRSRSLRQRRLTIISRLRLHRNSGLQRTDVHPGRLALHRLIVTTPSRISALHLNLRLMVSATIPDVKGGCLDVNPCGLHPVEHRTRQNGELGD